MSSISIRRALLSDKHAVTHEISKAWGDMDYFSDLYDEFISGPGCMGHVAVDGTDVVGITCGIVADGGQMVCTRGSKVKDSHQGQGIYMSILDAMNREIKQTTDVTWESVSVVKATAERINKSYTQRKSFREIMRLESYDMYLDVDNLLPLIPRDSFSDVRLMTHQDFSTIIKDTQACRRIFSLERMSVIWVPFRLMEENIKHFINDRTQCFLSSKQEVSSHNLEPSEVTMISVLFNYESEAGIVFESGIYATDFTHLESHLKCHMHQIQNAGRKKACWTLTFDAKFTSVIEKRVRECLAKYGFILAQKETVEQMIYFERRMV